jgi:poly(3-hydroxybutyrate) depolymerase
MSRAGRLAAALAIAALGSSGALPLLPAGRAASAATTAHGWHGSAGGIAGRSVYDRGEWIFTDQAFDDHGAAAHAFVPDYEDSLYPGDTSGRNFHGTFTYPAVVQTAAGGYDLIDTGYHYNAADLVELRVAVDAANVYFQARFNDLVGPDKTVVGIGIDSDGSPATGGADWPFGAGMHQQNGYEHFLTVYGTGADLTTFTPSGVATTSSLSAVAGASVSEDLHRYTYDVTVPRASLDPGRATWRVYAGAGLWDAPGHQWMTVQPGLPTPTTPGGGAPGLPNIFNLAFHHNEPVFASSSDGSDFNYWDEAQQSADLAASDISADHADIDFSRLEDGASTGVGDVHGAYERTYTSSFDFGEGLIREVRRPHDDYDYRSPTQPYEVYVPPTYNPAKPAPLWILEHYRGGNYRSYTMSAPGFTRVADALGAITVIPNARGQYRMCESDGEADFFEVLADAAQHYNIDTNRVYLGGMSMGGFCTWRLGLLYPDLFAATIVYSGWPYSAWPAYGAAGGGPAPGTRYDMTTDAANAADLPVQVIHGSNDEILPFPDSMGIISGVEAAGGEINVNVYAGRHHDSTFPGVAYEAGINWLQGRVRSASPALVRYVINPLTANPDPANGAPADYMTTPGWCNHPPFSGSLTRTVQPGLAFVYDRAYWMQGLQVRDCSQVASVTATSHALDAGLTTPVTRTWSAQSDSLGPYLNEGQSLSPAGRAPAPVIDTSFAGLAAATIDLSQAGVAVIPAGGVAVNVSTDGGLDLTLQMGGASSRVEVSLDGRQYATVDLGTAVVAVPTGTHVIAITPATPAAAVPESPWTPAIALVLVAGIAARRWRRHHHHMRR